MKIRICVAVDVNGKWNAAGGLYTDDEAETITLSYLDSCEQYQIYWVEAECLVPVAKTVKGKVKRKE